MAACAEREEQALPRVPAEGSFRKRGLKTGHDVKKGGKNKRARFPSQNAKTHSDKTPHKRASPGKKQTIRTQLNGLLL